jgi:hypothetical protein
MIRSVATRTLRQELMAGLSTSDVIALFANAVLFGVVLANACRIAQASAYLCGHSALALLLLVIAQRDGASSLPSPWLRFVHAWLPALLVFGMYFEIGMLSPQTHPLGDFRYDHALQAVDVWILGDPLQFVAHFARRPVSELLTLCYWAYYPFPFILPAVLYIRGAHAEFQRVIASIQCAFLLAYAGYLSCPAVGPHRLFDGARLAALDGYGLSKVAFALLSSVTLEPPDAFPSGHALLAVLVPALSRRVLPRLFPWLSLVGAGMVVATVYLRYHYLADVAVSFMLVPVAMGLGSALHIRVNQAKATAH